MAIDSTVPCRNNDWIQSSILVQAVVSQTSIAILCLGEEIIEDLPETQENSWLLPIFPNFQVLKCTAVG